jgi:hypothetical protein
MRTGGARRTPGPSQSRRTELGRQSAEIGIGQPRREQVSRLGDLRASATCPAKTAGSTTLAGGMTRRNGVEASAAWASFPAIQWPVRSRATKVTWMLSSV